MAAENKLPLQFTFSSRMEGRVTYTCVCRHNEPGCPPMTTAVCGDTPSLQAGGHWRHSHTARNITVPGEGGGRHCESVKHSRNCSLHVHSHKLPSAHPTTVCDGWDVG